MGLSMKQTMKIEERVLERANRIFDEAEQNMQTFLEVSQKWVLSVTSTPEFQRLPYHARRFFQGFHTARMDDIWRNHVVFAYDINGKIMTIEDEEWKTLDHNKITTSTGRYVWRNDIHKVWK